jgi:hypothetical protein
LNGNGSGVFRSAMPRRSFGVAASALIPSASLTTTRAEIPLTRNALEGSDARVHRLDARRRKGAFLNGYL